MKDYKTLISDIRTEACELADKLKRLEVFMMSEDFLELSPEQKGLLETQYDLMAKYKVTLVKRAHRINYEHAQNSGKEMPEPEKKLKVPSAPPTFYTNPTLCETCMHPKGGYSTCHDCENGSNYSRRPHENKSGNCKWDVKGHNGIACKDAPSDRKNMPCFEECD